MKNLVEEQMIAQIFILKKMGFDREAFHKMIDLVFDLAEEGEKDNED